MPRTKKPVVVEKEETEDFVIDPQTLIPSGSTLLNLALSDHAEGGWAPGKIVNVIGDRSAGKSMQALTMCAEVSVAPRFDDYKLVYDDAEAASEFNLGALFGMRMAERVRPPFFDKDKMPGHSETMQDFQKYFNRCMKTDKPHLYILDSLDSLTCDEEIEKMEANLKLQEQGKDIKGSYGMDKAKALSQFFRMQRGHIKATRSLLMVVSQVRDNPDPMAFVKKRRAGGRALEFYSSHEVWLCVRKSIKRGDYVVGQYVNAKITKNKITGKYREVDFPIYYDYGIDDVGSCIDWLCAEKHWAVPEKSTTIPAKEFKMACTRAKLIAHIEGNGLEPRLREITAAKWREIEDSLRSRRKPKYD